MTGDGLRRADARSASTEAGVHQQRRVDAVGERPQLVDRVTHVGAERGEHLWCGGRVLGDLVGGEAQVDGECDEVLLGAVVEVAFDPPPLGVRRRHQTHARGTQLVVGLAQVVERLLQRGVELAVVQQHAEPAAELGQRGVVGGAEPVAARGPADDDQPEQLAGMGRRRHPHLPEGPAEEDRRLPHLQPGPADDSPAGEDAPSRIVDGDGSAIEARHRRRARHTAGRVEPPDLGRRRAHRADERLGELHQELVVGGLPGGAPAERTHDVLGSARRAVQEPGGRRPGPPRARGQPRPATRAAASTGAIVQVPVPGNRPVTSAAAPTASAPTKAAASSANSARRRIAGHRRGRRETSVVPLMPAPGGRRRRSDRRASAPDGTLARRCRGRG